MAAWNSATQEVIRTPAAPWPDSPGWLSIDCGCCAGLAWSTLSPEECRDCSGSGHLALHVNSGVLAQYPGGPFAGVASADDVRRAVEGSIAP